MDEINFDGLVGPTHFYGGLAFGDLASMQHANSGSNPKEAALQGLQKMKLLMDLGLKQGIIPPHPRPLIQQLYDLGFKGQDQEVLEKAYKSTPSLFFSICSSSSMWVANSATCSPSCDTEDGKVHFTIANLSSMYHRNIESKYTYSLFQTLFPFATIHRPLPAALADEGAANHTRFSDGTHLFVYGREIARPTETRFPARQTKEACEAIARQHGLKQVHYLKQHPTCIDAGGFHNDVVAVGHDDLYLYHEAAYATPLPPVCKKPIKVTSAQLPLTDAIDSYLFNSQIITLPGGEKALISPKECESLSLDWLPIENRHFVNLTQSLSNGGGPACCRLRVLLNEEEQAKLPPFILLTDDLYHSLTNWVESHYRDRLTKEDLVDISLYEESLAAQSALSQILQITL